MNADLLLQIQQILLLLDYRRLKALERLHVACLDKRLLGREIVVKSGVAHPKARRDFCHGREREGVCPRAE